MKKYGLIGYPLSHSFSPVYFKEKFLREGIDSAEYKAYPMECIDDIRTMIFEQNISGLNVTIPYKESVMEYLDELSPEANSIGAVNTIKNVDSKLIGYNTDVVGFEKSLKELLGDSKIDKALILGSGGAAKAVKYVLDGMGITHSIVSRSKGDLRYTDIDQKTIDTHPLIVNTTPLGMYPDIEECPNIPYCLLTRQHFLYDLVYNPEKTLFLAKGQKFGAQILNGLRMLHLQAEESWDIWNK